MDLKFALRSLLKNPGFTLLATLVMALGIGANTAVFSVVNTVLLKPLAYRDPDRIVTIRHLWHNTGRIGNNVSAPDYNDIHDQNTSFAATAYITGEGGITGVQIDGAAEYVQAAGVSPEFFQVFQLEPFMGRFFTPEEQAMNSGGAVLLSYGYWQQRFGGNHNAIGRTVRVGNKALSIVGIAPPGFDYPKKCQIWFPSNAVYPENRSRSSHNHRVIAQLKPGVPLDQARAQMTSLATNLEKLYPASNEGKGIVVDRIQDTLVSNVRLTLYVLLGAVAVVLLIACANMANLLLAKATSRNREMAIRGAVGASRFRIIRQLIVESVVLAAVSGTAGLMLAIWGADVLVALAPANVPRLAETHTDGWVLAFTFAVSLLSSLLFGLAPALQASKVDLNDALKQGGSRTAGGAGGRMRSVLVVAEIALSVTLVAVAGLLIRSFQALLHVDNGYRPEKVLVAETSFPAGRDTEMRQRAVRFYDALVEDVRHLPGVSAAAGTAGMPGNPASNGGYWLDRLPPPSELSVNAPQSVFSIVGPGTFQALGISLVRGRDFDASDFADAQRVAIVNEALAKKSFDGQDPIGRNIFNGLDSPLPMKIIGVVSDVRQFGPATPSWPEIYMPYAQHIGWATDLYVMARTSGDPLALSETLRRKIREHSPDVPVRFTTMEAALSDNVAAPRFRTMLLSIFSAVALCLAMAGVYGLMAYVVGQRTNEIGIRMALGASARDVLRLVLKQGLTLALLGLVLGLAGAAAATRILSSLLFGVKASDPTTYLGVAALLGIVALAATYIPAMRAAKIDPLVALRQE